MRILYVTNLRIPNERAHSLQVLLTCDGFVQAGADVTLIAPRYRGVSSTAAYASAGIEPRFAIRYLPALILPIDWPFAFTLMTLSFAVVVRAYLFVHRAYDVLYSRGDMALFLPTRRLVWESHIPPKRMWRYRRLFMRALATVVVTDAYRRELVDEHAVARDRVILAPDGVDLARFAAAPSRSDARATLGLPADVTLALSTGSDIPWKGIGTLREAARLLPERFEVILLGEHAPGQRLVTAGRVPNGQIPLWLAAADVLVSTAAPRSDIADRYTLPLKVFEYLAAGRPIVAADTQSHREVLDEGVAQFYESGSAASLARAIEAASRTVGDTERALRAQERARGYSWVARARTILEHLTTTRP